MKDAAILLGHHEPTLGLADFCDTETTAHFKQARAQKAETKQLAGAPK
jgi:hypothetical protein